MNEITESKIVSHYVRNGILIGLFFPLLACCICIFYLTPSDYSLSFFKLHRDFPLLWIIDSAPIVLGLISYIVRNNLHRRNQSFIGQIRLINNELLEKNNQLQEYIEEKEVLLKEIHHRVKNNLQVITSLLSLQSSFIDDEKSKALFRYSQYRINSMAMIHEMLYNSKNLSKLDYEYYAKKLISDLTVSIKGSDHKIDFEIQVPDIHLNIDTAIPLGLLINEVITNSLKYGIPENHSGKIHLCIQKMKHANYRMTIGDNGVGFSEDINFRNSNSLGLMLIHKLSLQLKGTIEKDNQLKGTNYILNFQEIEQTS